MYATSCSSEAYISLAQHLSLNPSCSDRSTTMLFNNLIFAWVAILAGTAFAGAAPALSSTTTATSTTRTCRRTDYGTFAPLTTDRAAFRYCSSLLQGKVARRTVRGRSAPPLTTTPAVRIKRQLSTTRSVCQETVVWIPVLTDFV